MIQILFKVIRNNSERQQMAVKFCRENAPQPIENYRTYNISYRNLDFSSSTSLVESIRSVGKSIVEQQLMNEPILDANKGKEDIDSVDLDDFVGKMVSVEYLVTEELNDVKL